MLNPVLGTSRHSTHTCQVDEWLKYIPKCYNLRYNWIKESERSKHEVLRFSWIISDWGGEGRERKKIGEISFLYFFSRLLIHGNEMMKSTYTVTKKKERRQRPKIIGGNTKNILSSEIKNFFKTKDPP